MSAACSSIAPWCCGSALTLCAMLRPKIAAINGDIAEHDAGVALYLSLFTLVGLNPQVTSLYRICRGRG